MPRLGHSFEKGLRRGHEGQAESPTSHPNSQGQLFRCFGARLAQSQACKREPVPYRRRGPVSPTLAYHQLLRIPPSLGRFTLSSISHGCCDFVSMLHTYPRTSSVDITSISASHYTHTITGTLA